MHIHQSSVFCRAPTNGSGVAGLSLLSHGHATAALVTLHQAGLHARSKLLLTSTLTLCHLKRVPHRCCGACLPAAQKTVPCPMLSVASAVLSGPQCFLNLNPSLHSLWSNSQNGLGNILNAEWTCQQEYTQGTQDL